MGRRGLIVIVVVIAALGAWTVREQSKPPPPDAADYCAVWEAGISDLLDRFPTPPTTVSTLPAEDEMYIGISGGPPPIGPLWFVPDDEAAQADVVQLFEDLVDVSPDDLKRSSERQVDHYKLLSTDLPADPSEAMVDLGTGLLRGAGAGYEQIEAFIKENCGMPPYR